MTTLRSLILAVILVIICSATVFAEEKIEWVDKSYNFANVQNVLVLDLKFSAEETENDILQKILQEDFLENAEKQKKLNIVQSGNADVIVETEILRWSDGKYVRPEYTTWEQRKQHRERRHSDGSKWTETYYITVPVVHPAVTIYTSTVRVRFDVYDAQTNTLIVSRDEERTRESEDAHRGMFGRITKSFFDDLAKKVKKAK